MGADQDVITAIEAAVSAAPHNAALRADLVEALDVASRAADAAGTPEQAAGYRRLLDALGGTPPRPPTPAIPVPVAEPDGGDSDEIDAFLREVLAEAEVDVEQPSVTLANVGGLDDVKRRLEASFLGPLRNPELRPCTGSRFAVASCSTDHRAAARPLWHEPWPASWVPAFW